MTQLSKQVNELDAQIALAIHDALPDTLLETKEALTRVHDWAMNQAKKHPNSKAFRGMVNDTQRVYAHLMTLTNYVARSSSAVNAVTDLNGNLRDELDTVSRELDDTIAAIALMDDTHPQIAELMYRIQVVVRATEAALPRTLFDADLRAGVRERLYEAGMETVSDELIEHLLYVVSGDTDGDLSDTERDALRGFATLLERMR